MLVKNLLLTNSTKPEMELEDRKFLENFYREDIKKLETLLERNTPWKI